MTLTSSTVLVIDDDRDVREAMVETLLDQAVEAVGVDGGVAALRLLRGSAVLPALILLDLRMAGMSGADFRREQLGDPHLSSVPVVVVSADAHVHDQVLPAQGYLRKPLRIDDLMAQVRRFLPPPPATPG